MRRIGDKFVIDRIKKHLASQWQVVSEKDLHEKGCDLVLKDVKNKREARRFLIECKGKSYAKSAKSVNETVWLFALGQLISRMSVVVRLDSLLEQIGKVKKLQSKTQSDFIALEQSILSRAFSGEFV